MISYLFRFHGHGGLRYVYRNGQVVRGRYITLKYVENRRAQQRVAVVISKKVLKSAVGRNRIRRRLYEALRMELPMLHQKRDIVVIVGQAEVNDLSGNELTTLLRTMLTQANLYITPEN